MNPENLANFWRSFPTLDPTDATLRATLEARPLVRWDRGKTLVREGEECSAAPLVVEGALQVSKMTEDARQIKLYGLGPGECCPLTTSALMGGDPFPAIVTVEADTEAVMLPADAFLTLVSRSPTFRHLVFGQYARRLGAVIELVEALAFRRLDERLTDFLLREQCDRRLGLTHQEIADRLGTSREVISRLLKDFEAKGWLITHRGYLELTGL